MKTTRQLKVISVVLGLGVAATSEGGGRYCDQQEYTVPVCLAGGSGFPDCPQDTFCLAVEYHWCTDGSADDTKAPMCAGYQDSGGQCAVPCDAPGYTSTAATACTLGNPPPSNDLCGGQDDNHDGCINGGCTVDADPAQPLACTCPGVCGALACPPTLANNSATCNPANGRPEICASGFDNNCNGDVGEGCRPSSKDGNGPPGGPTSSVLFDCATEIGKDPILIGTRAATTEPFTDFKVAHVSELSLSRTYSSADVSLVGGGSAGIFGRGWHHDWEGSLTCVSAANAPIPPVVNNPAALPVCTITMGLSQGFRFNYSQTVTLCSSTACTEQWKIFTPFSLSRAAGDNYNMLVRQMPSGSPQPTDTWTLFLTDGREYDFQMTCDNCSGDTSTKLCTDVESGGTYRLTAVRDPVGNAVSVSYNRPSGILIALQDSLGHSLQVRSPNAACTTGYASELWYVDSAGIQTEVATYQIPANDLTSVQAADGATVRQYFYDASGNGQLKAVVNEHGDTVGQFAYDSQGGANGIVDSSSNTSINYGDPQGIAVTEYFRAHVGDTSDTPATSYRTLNIDLHVASVAGSCSCGAAQTMTWGNKRLQCEQDSLNHVTAQSYDVLGRLIRRTRFQGTGCAVPGTLPPDSTDETRTYSLQKYVVPPGLVAQGGWGGELPLEYPTSVTKTSTLSAGNQFVQTNDYNQTAEQGDPSGYRCIVSGVGLPSTVVCRKTESGYTVDITTGQPALELHTTFYTYDAQGRIAAVYGPVNVNRASSSDVMPYEERTYWSDTEPTSARRGRLYQVKRYPNKGAGTGPLVTSFDYDMFGAYQITAPNGAVTTIIKDARGRPQFVRTPDTAVAHETRYYDGLTPRLVLFPSGATSRLSYDSLGRLSKLESLSGDPEASGANPVIAWTEIYSYDGAGNRIHAERHDIGGNLVWQQDRAFDVQHHLVQDTNPESPGASKIWSYDSSGFLSAYVDEVGRGATYVPDGLNRATSVTRSGTDAQGNPTSLGVAGYVYQGAADAIASVTDGAGKTTTYQTDDFGRVSLVRSQTLSKSGDLRYAFDARGNVLQKADSFATVNYTYDGLDRLLTMSVSGGGPSYLYRYDEQQTYAGRLTSVVETDRTVAFTYDPVGRLASETISENGASTALTTTYTYDADGAPWQLTYPSGKQVQYDRDPATRQVIRVSDLATGVKYADAVSHAPSGPVTGLVFGNGLAMSRGINRRYEPLTISNGPLSLSYAPTPAGDIGSIGDTSMVLSGCSRNTGRDFAYDFLDRLTGATNWLAYGYDGAGNRVSETVGGIAAGYGYSSGTDRVTYRQATIASALAFGYDNHGNLSAVGQYDATASTVTQAWCMRHDDLGRLTIFGGTNSTSVSPDSTSCSQDSQVATPLTRFKYDARNRRLARQNVSSGIWTYIIPDASGNPLSELQLVNGSWTKVRDYVWLDGQPVAQVEYPAANVYYLHTDHLGLPRAMTNSNKQLVWNTLPGPYGDLSEKTMVDPLSGQTVVTNLRLPGQYDERLFQQVGLNLQGPYYNWNRWYLPGVGRYLEPDPIALRGGKNGRYGPDWYGYAVANPLKYVDPAGLYYCTYSVSTHTMACVPTDDSHPGTGFFSDQFVSGNNDIPGCQNNSACASFSDIGPAPQGFWSIDPPHWDGEHYRRDLIPVLLPDQNTWVRYGIQIHGCGSLTAPHCSTGCISTTRDNFDTLNALFDTESNNWLLVTP